MWQLGDASMALRPGMPSNHGKRGVDGFEASTGQRKESHVGPRLCSNRRYKPLHQTPRDNNTGSAGSDDVQQPNELLGGSRIATRADVIDQQEPRF